MQLPSQEAALAQVPAPLRSPPAHPARCLCSRAPIAGPRAATRGRGRGRGRVSCCSPRSAAAAPRWQRRRGPAPEPALCRELQRCWRCKGETHRSSQHLSTPLRSCSPKHYGAGNGKQQSPNSSGTGWLSSAAAADPEPAEPGQPPARGSRRLQKEGNERAHGRRQGPRFHSRSNSAPAAAGSLAGTQRRGADREQSPAASAEPPPALAAARGAAHGAARRAPWCQ